MKMNKLDLLKTSLALSMLAALSACGAAGGGSGGLGSGGAGRASGVLALPSATCGANACVSSAGGLGPLSTDSSAVLLDNAEFGYAYINSTFVPMVNEKMYQLEEAFKSNDLDQCGVSSVDPLVQRRQIDLVPDATYQLNATTSVVVTSAGLHTAPYTMEKKFVVSISGTPTVEVQVGCPSSTERSLYVRVLDGANRFEAWGHQSTSEKVIYAASDVGTEKRTLYFKSTSNSVFEIAAIVKDASLDGGAPISVSISGGADLSSSTGKLEVNFLTTAASALTASTGATFDVNDATYGGADKRHCYTNLSPIAISTTSSDCSTLFSGPGSAYLRGGVRALTDWSVSTLGSASISGTF